MKSAFSSKKWQTFSIVPDKMHFESKLTLYDASDFKFAVDAVYVINLASRPDRLRKVMRELHRQNITFDIIKRFEAIRPTPAQIPQTFLMKERNQRRRLGAYGCLMSHYNIIKEAFTLKKYNNILILEDDVEFTTDAALRKLGIAISQLHTQSKESPPRSKPESNPESKFGLKGDLKSKSTGDLFDLFYLSGSHIQPSTKVTNNVAKVSKTFTTSSYIINRQVAPQIIQELPHYRSEVDVYYAERIQSRNNSYCITPHLTRQSDGFSDIQQKHVSYKMKDPHSPSSPSSASFQ